MAAADIEPLIRSGFAGGQKNAPSQPVTSLALRG
jgi:hypothetical protein